MPSWNQIQQQLKHPDNPVVFFDITVGQTVSYPVKSLHYLLHMNDMIICFVNLFTHIVPL